MKNKSAPSSLVRQRMRFLLSEAQTIELNGYLFVTRKNNPQLFHYLDRYGFFKFHRSNTFKSIAGVHQVVLYLHRGWKLHYYSRRYCVRGKLECHHLDHVKHNNTPSNLWYVTPTENKVLADITQVCLNKAQGLYNGMAKFDMDIINFHRDVSMSFPQLLVKTLIATSNKFVNEGWNFLSILLDNLPFRQAKLLKHELVNSIGL